MQCLVCQEELLPSGLCPRCNGDDVAQLAEGEHTQHESVPEISPELERSSDEPSSDNDLDTSDEPKQENPNDEKAHEEPNSQPAASSGTADIKDSTLNSRGDINIIGAVYGVLQQAESGQKADEEKNLFGITKPLPPREINLSPSLQGQLDSNVTQLRKDQLILISCYNKKYALDAAQAVVERLDISHEEQKRSLYFENSDWEGSEISIHSLMQKRVDSQGEVAIIVDALEDSAHTFCESLLVNDLRSSTIKDELRKKKIQLLCVVDSTYIERRIREGRELNFSRWEISFLLPLLEQHQCMELEEKIKHQRKQGIWSRDESEFLNEITSYINSGQLRDLVKEGRKPIVDVESLVEKAGPIGKTVLYVASYFPNTTPTEFCRIVESLLSEQTLTVTTQSYILSDDGSKEPLQAEREVPLAQSWNEGKDAIFKRWLQEMISPKDSTRVIGFCDPALRESLREHFEKEHRFYLLDQFNALQKQGVLFHSSSRIAESATRLIIDRMLNYPDEYDTTWLVNAIIDLRQKIEDERAGLDNQMNSLRKISQRNSLREAYQRISELMSSMIEHHQLRGGVDQCLDYLIRIAAHDWVLNIIKQLRFVPQFDVIYWIKRLLNQADKETGNQAYGYLLSYLKKMDANIYSALSTLATWLPEEDRNPKSYSHSNYFALLLLIQYFLETTERFDHKSYGAWPSRYPLFAVKNRVEATEGLALLTRWLFHPGLTSLKSLRLGSNPYPLIAALLAQWTFILLGPDAAGYRSLAVGASVQPSNRTSSEDEHCEASESHLDPDLLLDLLIEQIRLRIDVFQRSELLKYWNKLDRDLLRLITSHLRPNDQQKELMWKRNCVQELTRRFQGQPARTKAS